MLNRRYSCPLLKREDILEGKVPTAPTIASMMAALEVQEALKLLHGLPVQAGSALVFNGVANQFYSTKLPRREDCLSHETYPEPVVLNLGHEARLRELFERVREHLEGSLSLHLERDLVASIACPRCGWTKEVFQPRSKVRQSDAVCPACRQAAVPETLSAIEETSPLLDRPLAALGIPAYDIVRVDGGEGSGFFF